MSNRFVAALACLFLGASMAIGQTPQPEPGPAPQTVQPVVFNNLWDELQCTCHEMCDHCASGVFTVDVEYLLWWIGNSKDNNVVAANNILTAPGVSVLTAIGDAEHAKKSPISGARFALGYWETINSPWIPGGIRDFGGEAVFFFIGQKGLTLRNDQSTNLVRPFFDLNNRQESGWVVAAPGIASGVINARAQASLWGAEANVWKNIYFNYPGTQSEVALMAGLRFLSADGLIQVGSTAFYDPNLDPASPFFPFAGSRINVLDTFATHNRFYGGQVGVSTKLWTMQKICIEGAFKLALGATSEDVNISGNQFRTFPNQTTATYNGGLLALPSNIGNFHNDIFAQVPEVDFKVSCLVTDHITLETGFSALYWNRIVRPGQQIDREIDITQIPNFPVPPGTIPTGLARPGVPFRQSDLWELGISLGLEYKW
ncbi:MAG TPA: BBP7 family outer membrane beta-barrel protein [Gemmataceae bacterium]|nr:BBP7 family outer membrane beta-barrel protein [Gemmataceae bacterium]